MNEIVKNYIEKRQSEIKIQKEKEKQEKLKELGVYQKIYRGEEGYDPQAVRYEWDTEKQEGRYFNAIVPEVTDEEYEEILKVSDKKVEVSEQKNSMATVLKTIGIIIYVVGFVVGFMTIDYIEIALSYWMSAFISGTLFLGFSEVIRLLHEINNK